MADFDILSDRSEEDGGESDNDDNDGGARCSQCGLDCRHPSALKRHMRTHSGERPYKCTDCSKSFARKGALKRHKITHSGMKQFGCDQCGKSFAQQGNLGRHERIHTGERGFECDKCGKSFNRKGVLRMHERVHSDERLHDCKECKYACKRRADLVVHMRTHTGDRPHACGECGRRFTQGGHLKKHTKRHEENKRWEFVCAHTDGGVQVYDENDPERGVSCDLRFKTKADLEKHLERSHTEAGLASKIESETKLAKFLTEKDIRYERNWDNMVSHSACASLDGLFPGKFSCPDFYLFVLSVAIMATAMVGCDQNAHRRYKIGCESSRMLKIYAALRETGDFSDTLIYIRFNPDSRVVDGVLHDMPIENAHAELLGVLQSLADPNSSLSKKIRKGQLNLIYLSYDKTDGELDIYSGESLSLATEECRKCVVYSN